MTEHYQLGRKIYEDEAAGLQVFEAQDSRPRRLFAKRYSFASAPEIDSLLKAAGNDAHEEHSLEAIIANAAFTDPKKTSHCYIDLVYENLLGREMPWEYIKRNQRKSTSPGLDNYRLGDVIHRRDFFGYPLEVRIAESLGSRQKVVIKSMKNVRQQWKGNRILKEAIAQALVSHKHNCGLLDIACTMNDSESYDFSLVMEKLNHDLENELQERKAAHKRYTSEELIIFLYTVTAGLLHAKERVAITQGFAHRDIKLANIFRASEKCVKVGDFGSVWNQGGSDSVPRRIPSLLSATEFEEFAQSGDGTLGYWSPEMREMMLGSDIVVDSYASDVFSLGVCLLELVKLDHLQATRKYSDELELAQNLTREIASTDYHEWIKFTLTLLLNTDPSKRPSVKFINHLIVAIGTDSIPIWPVEDLECMTSTQLKDEISSISHLPKIENLLIRGIFASGMNIAHAFIELLLMRLDDAEQFAQSALKSDAFFQCAGERAFSCCCRAVLALIRFHGNQLVEARDYATWCINFLWEIRDEKYIHPWIDAQALLAQTYSAMKDHRNASEKAALCLCLLQTTSISRHARSAVVAYRVLGIELMSVGEMQKAQQYLLQSLNLIVQFFPRNFRLMIQAYTDLAVLFSKEELTQESLHCIKRALAFMWKYCNEEYELYYDTLKILRDANDHALQHFLQTSEDSGTALYAMLSNYDIIFKIFHGMGKLTEAEEILRQALDAPLQYEEGPSLAGICHSLSMMERELGKLTDAERFCLAPKRVDEECEEKYQAAVAKYDIDLAEIYFSMGKLTECGNKLSEGNVPLDITSSVYWQKCNLDLLLNVFFGKMAEAEQIVTAILQAFNESSLFITAELCNSLAFYYAAKRQLQESKKYTEKAISVLSKNNIADCSLTALINCNSAVLLLQMDKLQEAELCACKCIDILLSLNRKSHPCAATAYLCLSLVYRDLGNEGKSWEMAEKCIDCKEQESGELLPDFSIFFQLLPILHSGDSEILSDSPDFNPYGRLRNKLMSEQNVWGVWNSVIISFLLLQLGKVNDTADLLYNSPVLTSSIFPSNSFITAALWHNYACCLLELQQYDYALKCAEESLSVYEKMKNNGGETGIYHVLAVIHHLSGESTVAAYFADKFVGAAVALSKRVRETLASIYAAAGENEKAEDLRQQS